MTDKPYPIRLTEMAARAGCAAKFSAGGLREILAGLPLPVDPNVLVGHSGSDDAAVYRLSDELALVLTVDFFTPIVDDPYDFGRVAATNAISDVYAMGGRPVVALNIAGFPEGGIVPEVLGDIMRGGADVARSAGVSIVGGHTVNDPELKYGLSVVGLIDPRRIVRNAGAKPGDVLILTKALGTGVLATALKRGELSPEGTRTLVESMTLLNREASEIMLQHDPHAGTDITGFGLIGHANEMAEGSDATLVIHSAAVPIMDGAHDAAEKGFITGGGKATQKFLNDRVSISPSVDATMTALLFDPQTSGGLLIAVASEHAASLLAKLKKNHPHAALVGECVARRDVSIVVD
jgi:selenide, water dikinase